MLKRLNKCSLMATSEYFRNSECSVRVRVWTVWILTSGSMLRRQTAQMRTCPAPVSSLRRPTVLLGWSHVTLLLQVLTTSFNPLTPTVVIWVQLQSILCVRPG